MANTVPSLDPSMVEVVEQLFEGSDVGRNFLDGLTQARRDSDLVRIFESLERLENQAGTARDEGRIESLRNELKSMSEAIIQTRSEISAIKPDEDSSSRIMAATEELDAIITATERATSDILGAAERIQTAAQGLREAGIDERICSMFDEQSTNIFMACSFQDITGQRVQKVVNLLRYLEQRINDMVNIWGTETGASETKNIDELQFNPQDTRPDAHLLSGPAKEGAGVDQDEVDRMLNGDLEPVAAPEPVAESAAAEAPEPTPDPVPVAEVTPEPAIEPAPAPEPVTETASEPVAEAAPEPVAGVTPEAVEPQAVDEENIPDKEVVDQDDIDALFG